MSPKELHTVLSSKKELVSCVTDIYRAGLTTSVSGNHSIRNKGSMWITPSAVPRYAMVPANLVRVDIRTGKAVGKVRPSIEAEMHRRIYNVRRDISAIVHTHSPYTIAVSISSEFIHVIEEARIVVGTPIVIPNELSGSLALAESVAAAFSTGARAIVVKNHGVVAGARDIHGARAIVESLEEWSKILTLAKMFGGAKAFLSD